MYSNVDIGRILDTPLLNGIQLIPVPEQQHIHTCCSGLIPIPCIAMYLNRQASHYS